MKKHIEFTLTILAVIFGSACLPFYGFIPGTEPAGFSFPKADIIYQALNHRSSIQDESNNLIGFVNADGSGNTLIKLKYRAYYPVLSLEAGGLFFHENLPEPTELQGIGGGHPYFLSSSGIYTYCGSLYAGQFIFPVPTTSYLLEYDPRDIELADIKSCKVIKRLVYIPDGVSSVEFVDSAYPSYSGKSVIFTKSNGTIYIMDIETGSFREVLQGGYNASFSPDDQRIAYVGDNGIYVANADGIGSKLIVRIDSSIYTDLTTRISNAGIPYPFWSPDGTSLVYHKCTNFDCQDLSNFSIYKVDVNSGQEQKIVDGGMYPVWIK